MAFWPTPILATLCLTDVPVEVSTPHTHPTQRYLREKGGGILGLAGLTSKSLERGKGNSTAVPLLVRRVSRFITSRRHITMLRAVARGGNGLVRTTAAAARHRGMLHPSTLAVSQQGAQRAWFFSHREGEEGGDGPPMGNNKSLSLIHI